MKWILLVFSFLGIINVNFASAEEILLTCSPPPSSDPEVQKASKRIFGAYRWYLKIGGDKIGNQLLWIETSPNREEEKYFIVVSKGEEIRASLTKNLEGETKREEIIKVHRITGKVEHGIFTTNKQLSLLYDSEEISKLRTENLEWNKNRKGGLWMVSQFICEKTEQLF